MSFMFLYVMLVTIFVLLKLITFTYVYSFADIVPGTKQHVPIRKFKRKNVHYRSNVYTIELLPTEKQRYIFPPTCH